ncbi:amino acid ABC transporter permease [Allonocardiopsis opalescens]|uniref:Amino acid ABC transporter membrane protein 2 (PAAT family) n=1 Tax=Allonocardiopsis opalescens TaxID=1144618 RepID=A0A2T0QFH2_9ACTN|nr:amino acid ABC transporter permease [Allonocardiopsis opalescens]PRY02655.1 amino acid ABC transporter membrane protein 2 (PAAT family) [Allonocardiopsis opalescens]
MNLLQQSQASVLFDAPGPKARARYTVYSVITIAALIALLAWVVIQFDRRGDQWAAEKWTPFLQPETWTAFILPGMANTLGAAAVATVFALVFGVIFGIGRLSDHAWVRVPAGMVVEFFRAIPLLMLIFFTMAIGGPLGQALTFVFAVPFRIVVDPFTAVVIGLTLYNGSVLAEIFRAGINAVPKGQSEAAYSLGMRKSQVMRLVLLPQAVTTMMPAIIMQLVVLLKDSALGYIVAFPEMLRAFTLIATGEQNVIPAAMVCAVIYIAINLSLTRLAIWLERRNARRGRATAHVGAAPGVDAAVAAVPAASVPTPSVQPDDTPEPVDRDGTDPAGPDAPGGGRPAG